MRPEITTLLEWVKPTSVTGEEIECVNLLRPGDYEMYNEKLNNILVEAKEIFVRMGITSMLRSGDLIVGIYTSQGDMATCSAGTYLHAVSAQLPVKFIVNNWLKNPTVGVNNGDIFYANEALYGGIHNPDQIAMMPVFNDGELIAWTIAAVHQPETGGAEPGGMITGAKSVCDEGMRITPIKIGENFRLRDDLLEMMENMVVRTPRMQMIDVKARATSCDRLRRRIVELAQQNGNGFVKGLLRKLIIEAEQASRRRITAWNDGTYRGMVLLDTEGVDLGLLRVFCTLHKKADRITFDFTGTSPEHDGGGYHGLPHQVLAMIAVYLFAYAFHDLPVSSGSLAPIDLIVPGGSFYNPDPKTPLSCNPPACIPALSVTFVLFGKMLFDSEQRNIVSAPQANGVYTVVAGVNQWGVPVADITAYGFNTEGQGARLDMDGVDAYGFPLCHVGRSPDAEFVESEFPLFHLFQKFQKDSCGFGKYRGGSGTTTAYVIHHVPWALMNSNAVNFNTNANLGLFGGYPPASRPGIQVTHTDLWKKMARGDKDIPSDLLQLITERSIQGEYTVEALQRPGRVLKNGDIFTDLSDGGAGYGDVLERPPEMVIEDLRKEIISHWVAQNVYHVAYDPATLQVDHPKTEALRKVEFENRKRRGKRYEDFTREWLQKRPPEEAIKHWGSWPDAKKVRDIVRV
jgi:N-methylhydantoinase B/oxoprolinase/acetone carboxylase alpha subunit